MAAPEQQPVRILVVDDIERNLVALEALLASPSVTVVRARSGEEAVSALSKDKFAVILLDVRMPGMDGFETAEAIRNKGHQVRTAIAGGAALGLSRDADQRSGGAGHRAPAPAAAGGARSRRVTKRSAA
jgi:CheY-like chemotaxis protein